MLYLQRYFLVISYQGMPYNGWQKQKHKNTIQNILEEKFSLVLGRKIIITGSSRTDTGVHALHQVAHIDLPCEQNITQLIYRINRILPKTIVIKDIYKVKNNAHARFDAQKRTYIYKILQYKDPFSFLTHYFLYKSLCIHKMNKSTEILCKEKNFKTFSKKSKQEKHFLCHIWEAKWHQHKEEIIFSITANRFLRGMVRSIVGTMLMIGQNKLSLSDFLDLIKKYNRNQPNIRMAPAQGLYLQKVFYAQDLFLT